MTNAPEEFATALNNANSVILAADSFVSITTNTSTNTAGNVRVDIEYFTQT